MFQGLIEWVAARGLTPYFFFGFQILAFLGVFIMALWVGKKLEIPTWKSMIIYVIVYPLADLLKRIMFWIESGFQVFGGENVVRVFVYVPVIAYFVAVLLKVDRKKLCDFLAPLVVFSQAIGHLGCIFTGCCQGFPMSWGIYNIQTGLTHFPTQLVECTGALIITIYMLCRAKKLNYESDGLQYPLMLILFGSTRFIFEFFRDNEKIWMNISALAFHALFAFLVGVVAYILVKRHNQKAE